tara:strand:- start:301 stop:1314 length:1014 start_codon:yes stop_codon:yes gene_type:complete
MLNGRMHAARWKREIAVDILLRRKIKHMGPPGLAAVVIGDRPDSLLYVRRKGEACEEVGIRFHLERLPSDADEDMVVHVLRKLNSDNRFHGVLLQLPVPAHLNESRLLELINPMKDVDGLHPYNVGRLAMRGTWRPTFMPCAPLGCVELLWRENIDIRGRSIAVLGDSNVVGMPISWLLRDSGASTISVVHGYWLKTLKQNNLNPKSSVAEDFITQNLLKTVNNADIIISAIGCAEVVKRDWIKMGATVIDVGINPIPWDSHEAIACDRTACTGKGPGAFDYRRQPKFDYQVVGDVAAEEVSHVANAMTPVPGGIGPMTIAALLSNTYLGASRQGYL